MAQDPLSGVVVGIPVKPFDDAKQRLSDVLGSSVRRRLGEELAAHTAGVVAAAGGLPLVLSADHEVTEWARTHGIEVLLDEGSSLDRAASAAVEWALTAERPWMICHADLPLLAADELAPAIRAVESGRTVLAPSSTGGTSLLGAQSGFRFSYGPGSFQRHLARAEDPAIVFAVGLALDLDEPSDLDAVLSHRRGSWLADVLGVA